LRKGAPPGKILAACDALVVMSCGFSLVSSTTVTVCFSPVLLLF